MRYERIDEGLFRILVPFEDLTTTVYIVVGEDGVALIDAATTTEDVDMHILPTLAALDIAPETVRYLLLSHEHGDHAGGKMHLLAALPRTEGKCAFSPLPEGFAPLKDGEVFLGRLRAVLLSGHTEESFGFYDEPTGTLLSADCLQLYGIGKYRSGVTLPELYRRSVERVRALMPRRIVAAHEYDPLGSVAMGEDEIAEYLSCCLRAIENEKMIES